MKHLQIQFPSPRQAVLTEIPAGEAPIAPDEVAGRTLASVVSAGTEIAGAYVSAPEYPASPGYSAVFEIEEVGSDVADLAAGDRVFCMGPHRSSQRTAQSACVKVPDGLDPGDAVLARLMGVSMSTLTTTTARPPQPVVVTGLGPVGYLASAIFSACGYSVTACDPVASRRELAQQIPGIRVVPALSDLDPALVGRVALAIECSGHEQAALDCCRVVRKRGEVVLVGVPWTRRTDLPAFDLLHAVFHHYVVLRSGWEWEVPLNETDFRTGNLFGNFHAALRWLAAGRIPVAGIAAPISPADCQQAYQDLLHGRAGALTFVFDWTRV